MSLLAFTDPVFELHRDAREHPECPGRLAVIRRALEGSEAFAAARLGRVRAADDSELRRVHRAHYLAALESRVRGRRGHVDPDTFFNEHTFDAVMAAAGSAADAATAALEGEVDRSLVLVRPPGHHAEADRAMGFCFINNAAVAASAARAAGAERVAIVDWDVHHGNGTQHIFEDDPSVLFVSLHQFPFYPGTGAPAEIGVGAGEGATVNIGLPAGSGDADYLHAVDAVVVPTLESYRPDAIIVSAGFDASECDVLAGMRVTTRGFEALARRIDAVARRLGVGAAAVLEGGYDLIMLPAAVLRLVEVFSADGGPRDEGERDFGAPGDLARRAVFATIAAHRGANNRWVPRDVASEPR